MKINHPSRPPLAVRIVAMIMICGAFGFTCWWFLQNEERELTAMQVRADSQQKQQTKTLKRLKERIAAEKIKQEEARKKAAQEVLVKTLASETVSAPEGAAASDCNTSKTHNNPAQIDALFNKKHCLVPLDFAPQDLVTVLGATISKKAAADYQALSAAASAAGYPFRATSSYRSYQSQVTTYRYWVQHEGGDASKADIYSARPGYSEHQTGLSVDIAEGSCVLSCFTDTQTYKWIAENAHIYGFIERYPAGKEAITGYQHESWHLRYVGKAVAADMRAKGVLTLEEYWGLEGGGY